MAEQLYLSHVHLLRRLRREDDPLGLSMAQASALSRLVAEGPLGISALARAEGVRVPTMTRLVQQLERDGLIVRRQSETDRRSSVVRHTSRAIQKLEQGRAARVASLGQSLEKLSARDRATLTRSLEILERIASQPDDDA